MTSLRIELDGLQQAAWERLFDAIPDSTLEQSWTYGEAVRTAAGRNVHRGLISNEEGPVGLVQVFGHRLFGLVRVSEILRGPLFLPEATSAERAGSLALVARTWPRGILHLSRWLPEIEESPEAHAMLREAGVRQVVTGYSTRLVDLTLSEEVLRRGLDGKWRNALAGAEKAGMRVRPARGGDAVARIAGAHDKVRRRRRFVGPSGATAAAFLAMVRRKRDLLAVTVSRGSTPLSGALFLGHGQAATYYMGWTSKEGREANAQNLAL
ncbi:MAG: hypothetical protein RJQ21_17110, partial [Rhodospirillales bacterium]